MARINRAVELLAQGQPVYYTGAEDRSYEGGVQAAQTWADYINYELEHAPFDVTKLSEFMRGLAAGGPTRSGHRTPAVIVTMPLNGSDFHSVNANAWVIKQLLATGVHGLLLCHAEDPEAVRSFVQHSRYPFNRAAVGEGLDEGRRGGGGQASAAAIWGVSAREYLDLADPWPLNPRGELLLGLKIENKRALANVEESLKVPGIAFAEWGPGDMGMSLGFPDNHDEPYPPEMQAARSRVLAACKLNNVAFLNSVRPDNVAQMIDEGVRVGASGRAGQEAAEAGRKYTKRTMPW
ncbi:MAG TPA: aldolase/citrate lyase family protein [Chloroflexota bacterium]|nr:aldolase/citrate lyase family protein [Chloroflexota bacterium]